MQNPLKFVGVPQTPEPISTVSGPKSSLYCAACGAILLVNCFFLWSIMCLNCEYITRQSCAMVRRRRIFGEFLRPVFPASRVQHVSDLHSKLALRPHHVWKYGWHPIYDGWEKARKRDRRKKEETTGRKYNGLPYFIWRPQQIKLEVLKQCKPPPRHILWYYQCRDLLRRINI